MTRVALLLISVLALGCGDESNVAASDLSAAPIGDAECAACAMIVRDQPTPRGQLVHRDGTRVHFCSIADLVTYLAAPSPHGSPQAIYVEVMAPSADPDERSTEERTSRPVGEAGFVYGDFERPVMGEAVLTFGSMEEARAAALRLDAHAVTFDELRAVLGNDGRAEDP